LDTGFGERLFDFIQFEWLNDRLDHLHNDSFVFNTADKKLRQTLGSRALEQPRCQIAPIPDQTPLIMELIDLLEIRDVLRRS
jgi:hypothetical protein